MIIYSEQENVQQRKHRPISRQYLGIYVKKLEKKAHIHTNCHNGQCTDTLNHT
jgi:hypothetical protein